MSFSHANGLPLVLGILLLGILVFVLPLLHEGRTYRAATLFSGLTAGILTTSIFLDDWARTHEIDWGELTTLLLVTMPKFYGAALIIGGLVIPKYVLLASTTARAITAGLAGAVAYYFLTVTLINVIGAAIYIYRNSPLSSHDMLELLTGTVRRIYNFDWLVVTATLVSALVAMVATTAIIQKTDDFPPLGRHS